MKDIILMIRYRLVGKDPLFEIFIKDKKTLDIGCGQGGLLRKKPELITGIDLNEGVVNKLKKEGLNVVLGSAVNLPFGDGEFEVVHCQNVIEHLTPVEARQMLSEVSRVLRPSGKLILLTPSEYVIWNTFGHVKPYPPIAVKKIFRENSLEAYDSIGSLVLKKAYYLGRFSERILFALSSFLSIFSRIFCGMYIMIIQKK